MTAPGLLDDAKHHRWLADHLAGLVRFVAGSADPAGGFHWLDADGRPLPDRTPALFLTARMVHVAALATLRGLDCADGLLDHGLASLAGPFADAQHGGWVSERGAVGRKSTYDHVQVALAAASASVARPDAAAGLLERAVDVVDTHLWREPERALAESFAPDWSDSEDYRGANANMHGVEAFLALGDVTGEARWHQRALAVAERLIHGEARASGWLLPEHYTADWEVRPEHHADQPDHPFRPYGATFGHSLEWARFLVGLHHSPLLPDVDWLLPAAEALTRRALDEGWAADGTPGLVYTVDWDGRPVVRNRLHWPVCEAIQATAVLARTTGDPHWAEWYARLWEHATTYFVDDLGTWVNDLRPDLSGPGGIWPGRPDVYHCAGAAVVPVLPATPFLTLALAGRRG